MWNKLSQHNLALSLLAGLAMVLAFSPFNLLPVVLGLPILLTHLIRRCATPREGFRYGFFTSLVIMLGGFYWVTYVIHVFGYLPWSVSFLIFLGFCGVGAINFPLFVWLAVHLNRRFNPDAKAGHAQDLWYAVGLPALFTLVEFFIPKLFPWYVGHTTHWVPWLTQIVEITGASFLTFLVFSLGCSTLIAFEKRRVTPVLALPLVLLALTVAFSVGRLNEPPPPSRPLRVALIQANIGSLEKAAARKGAVQVVESVIDRYIALTEVALKDTKQPDLIVWPETAMPFSPESDGLWSLRIRNKVLEWKIPLLTGGYSVSPTNRNQDYNAAILLEPSASGILVPQVYRKMILLAFGEYFPGGEFFPVLYRWFPQVSHFARGKEQNLLILPGDKRMGVTICYEAIDPAFYRGTIQPGPQVVVNLTNDSWFGPTAEPHQHGSLSIFRAIEHRVPLIRVTNTGVSFTVDRLGRTGQKTPVYDEGTIVTDVDLPDHPPRTVYLRYGEWFIGLCFLSLAGTLLLLKRRRRVPLPS